MTSRDWKLWCFLWILQCFGFSVLVAFLTSKLHWFYSPLAFASIDVLCGKKKKESANTDLQHFSVCIYFMSECRIFEIQKLIIVFIRIPGFRHVNSVSILDQT